MLCVCIIRMVLVQGRHHGRNLEFIVTPHNTQCSIYLGVYIYLYTIGL